MFTDFILRKVRKEIELREKEYIFVNRIFNIK